MCVCLSVCVHMLMPFVFICFFILKSSMTGRLENNRKKKTKQTNNQASKEKDSQEYFSYHMVTFIDAETAFH